MSFIQRLICSIVPKRIAHEIESESRGWKLTCDDCGASQSVWDAGGVRWKSKGAPRVKVQCAGCRQVSWHGMARR